MASGYPTPGSVVLWTRLAPEPKQPGGGISANDVVPVTCEIATDERMRNIVRTSEEFATAQYGHSIHCEPSDLEPGRDYWYRFTAGGMRSPIGRTRTSPARDANTPRLRVAIASCQQYEHGYFLPYRHMLADELDLIVHVGDYMYESSWGSKRIRHHETPETFSLDDYRARYALYRSDKDLQAAHAQHPWLVTWDDHEVENDYAGATSEEDDARSWFVARRAAAYQAYYEHMPLPRRALPFAADLRLFTQRSFGPLVNVLMLDSRQYRTPLACTKPAARGSGLVDCAELRAPDRTKLGAIQEAWVAQQLSRSSAQWNLLAQGTLMTYANEGGDGKDLFRSDTWNGYHAARERLMGAIADSRAKNPVVLSGDIHAFVVANLNRVPHDRNSPVVASELVATSISAEGSSQANLDRMRASNPNILFANSAKRGYLRLDVTAEHLQADLVGVESVTDINATASTQARFVIENGRAGPISA
ncbi:MAG TPA: alkaline phosphatase D family protein [Steroidobacteraceae bacterium]|nr:alkaline phosphatase D family protein [Steroidobacteraceae bacterium]